MRALAPALALAVALLAACGNKGDANEPNSSGASCSKGEYFVPGCNDEPGIVAGCYERCAGAQSTCGAGTTCATATVMPACALSGAGECDSCTEEVALCVPWGGE